jgi:serine/threonine-protein kinase HipA
MNDLKLDSEEDGIKILIFDFSIKTALLKSLEINPSIDKEGLALSIDMNDISLDFKLAKSVGDYFQLNNLQMETIIKKVTTAVKSWKKIADEIGISKQDND